MSARATAPGTWDRLISAVSRDAGLRLVTTVEVSRTASEPPGAVLDALVGAAREALRNVARHAGVDEAEVVINRQADDLVALVVDRGRGFDPEQVPDDRLGLAESVRGRIQDLGGSVTLWSRPGAGTTVMLTVPVPAT